MKLFKKRIGLIKASFNKRCEISAVHFNASGDYWTIYVHYNNKKMESFDYYERFGDCFEDAHHDFKILARRIR